MRAVVIGAGSVGARAARQLSATDGLEGLVVADLDSARAEALARSLGPPARALACSAEVLADADVAVIAVPEGHRRLAEAALERGVHVVSVAEGLDEARSLLDLDAEAHERDLTIVVGAGFSPGLTCVLARHAAAAFETVEEVHVAAFGVGGPACARARRRALRTGGVEWDEGGWKKVRPGSGRQLCWFPDPVGARECFRAGTATSLILGPAFPAARRITARVATGMGERVASLFRLPTLPGRARPEGGVGAIRVEVRGRRDGTTDVRVLGALDRPALGAAAVAAVAAAAAADGRFRRTGAAGLAELVDEPAQFLHELARRGVRAAVYEGVAG